MRDLILKALVVVLCTLSLVRARFGLLGYYWFGILRPDILSWSGPNRYSFLIAVSTMLGSVLQVPERLPLLIRNPILRTLLLLQVPFVLSAVFAVNPELSYPPLWQFFRVLVMALWIPLLFTSLADLRLFTLVVAFSLGALGSKFGLFGIMHGGVRFGQGFGGMLADNNTLAMGLAMGLPLIWHSRSLVRAWWLKLGLLAMFVCNVAAVVMTFSRGASMAMGVGLLLIIWRARHRAILLFSMAVVAVPILILVGSSYMDRIATLTSIQTESSAYSRVLLARAAVAMWADYPLLGVGFGRENQQQLLGSYLGLNDLPHAGKVIHNTYVQVLVDSGIFAFLLFTGLMLGTILWLGRCIRRLKTTSSELTIYPVMIQTSLIVYAVDSLTVSRAEFDLFYVLIVTAALIYELEKELVAEEIVEEPVESPAARFPALPTYPHLANRTGPASRQRQA